MGIGAKKYRQEDSEECKMKRIKSVKGFFSLLLPNDTTKYQVLGIFSDQIDKSLREVKERW